MKLYHISPSRNDQSILKTGITPSRSKRTVQDTWVCDETMLKWALEHMADRHGVSIDKLTVWVVRLHSQDMIRTYSPGLWRTKTVMPVRRTDARRIKSFSLETGRVRLCVAEPQPPIAS